MKKIFAFVVLVALLILMFVPVTSSAADGELLIAVNWLSDSFRTVNQGTSNCNNFLDKFDISKSTSDMLFMTKKADCPSDVWSADVFYIEDTGYYVTNDTKYTIYFEVASVHYNKYSGIPLLHENSSYDSMIMLIGSFSDDGDDKDSAGNRWTEFGYAYDYANHDSLIGEGGNGLMYCHPPLSVEDFGAKGLVDNCTSTPVTELKFSTIKVEFDGLSLTTWWLDSDRNWQKGNSNGEDITYSTEFGSEIVLGTYTRNSERHNCIRNLKLLQGTGLTYDQIWTAKQTTEPKPAKPEDPTTAEVSTKTPETKAPETKAPETETPQVDDTSAAPVVTETPKNEKGCASAVAFIPVIALAAAGALFSRRKR